MTHSIHSTTEQQSVTQVAKLVAFTEVNALNSKLGTKKQKEEKDVASEEK